MKALVHAEKSGISGLLYRDFEVANPEAGQVRIKLKSAGLNHRDLFVLTRHTSSEPPLVIGSDGAGIVDAVGPDVLNVHVGDEVLVNPSLGWKEKSDAPPQEFEILGLPDHGTFAQKIVLSAENVVLKPAYLSFEEAGVLSLAALTAYRALFTRGRLKAGMTVFVPGIGSGVATFLLQFAKAAGATVYVTSRSEEKRNKALELGADKAIDSVSDWNIALAGKKVDLVIESIGAATFTKSLSMLRPGGTMVTFGASAGDEIQINIRNFFYGQYNLLGTTMGSAEEYTEMLDFMMVHQIHPVLDSVFPLHEYEQAFRRMENAAQIGKIGFRIED
jgi:zinc-binding alcohol dehydrogenase/oxidoreductase